MKKIFDLLRNVRFTELLMMLEKKERDNIINLLKKISETEQENFRVHITRLASCSSCNERSAIEENTAVKIMKQISTFIDKENVEAAIAYCRLIGISLDESPRVNIDLKNATKQIDEFLGELASPILDPLINRLEAWNEYQRNQPWWKRYLWPFGLFSGPEYDKKSKK